VNSWVIALAWIALAGPLAAQTEYHFDFGPPRSPVAAGFTGVHAREAYSPAKGYGWSAGMPVDYTAPKPPLNRRRWYHFDPHFFYDEMVSDLRVVGLACSGREKKTPHCRSSVPAKSICQIPPPRRCRGLA
jgi:hypothetical protein